MRNQIANLTINLNELKSEVDDIKNIGLRKTYNFSKHPPKLETKSLGTKPNWRWLKKLK